MSLVVYGSRPAWGTPDFSPFVIKLETWLRLADVPYTRRNGLPPQAPKGKIPYVDLDGTFLGDSQLIIEAVTRRYDVRLDEGLDPVDAARGRAIRRMIEEGTYFLTLRMRWIEEDGWAHQYPAFKTMFPAPLAPLAMAWIRRTTRRNAWAQGAGRHTREEVVAMAVADLEAIELLLGDQPFVLGAKPRSVDATVYAFLTAVQKHPGTTPVHEAARRPALAAYTERIASRWWPATELAAT